MAISHSRDDCRSVAHELFELLRPHRLTEGLEVEVRLCHIKLKQQENGKTEPSDDHAVQHEEKPPALRIVHASVEASVTPTDYALLLAYCKRKSNCQTQSSTRDVISKGSRYTYATNDKSSRCIEHVRKRRLFVRDLAVSSSPYGLRFSVSTEIAQPLPPPRSPPPHGFTRIKERQCIRDGRFRYDMTKVSSKGVVTYEVELEGAFTNCAEELTEKWLEELLDRATALARVPLSQEEESDRSASEDNASGSASDGEPRAQRRRLE